MIYQDYKEEIRRTLRTDGFHFIYGYMMSNVGATIGRPLVTQMQYILPYTYTPVFCLPVFEKIKYPNIQISKYPNIQIFKYSNIQT